MYCKIPVPNFWHERIAGTKFTIKKDYEKKIDKNNSKDSNNFLDIFNIF
jgi:hypothetical protein